MGECSNTKNNRIENILSITFEIAVSVAVVVCLIGMIYCFVSFCKITNVFNAECIETMQDIQSVIEPNDESDSHSNLISNVNSDKNDVIDNLISHMESMVVIQESSNKNSLMSFIYGLLSSVLVGVCVVFVEKSRKNADEAKRNAEEVQSAIKQAKEDADKAVNLAEKAERKAREKADATKKASVEAELAAKTASEASTIASESNLLARLIIINSRIITAKSALGEYDRILANSEIYYIPREVKSVFEDKHINTIQKSELGVREMGIIYNGLVDLKKKVDELFKRCGDKYSGGEWDAMKTAAENYDKLINKAIETIDLFIEKQLKPKHHS